MLTIDKVQLFDHVIEQHVNEAAFLWMLRSQAMTQAHHTVSSIVKLEQRINHHLKGLSVAPESAWKFALASAEFKEGGEIFVLAILAFTSGESGKINAVLELGTESKETRKGLVSALGWLPSDKVNPWLMPWIESNSLQRRYLSIAACSVRRLDPQLHLNTLFNNPQNIEDISLCCRMLRLIGELKRHDLAPVLKRAQYFDNKDAAFWAHWSALMLGDRTLLQDFKPYVLKPNPLQAKAIDVAFRCLDQTQTWDWMNALATTSEQTEQAIMALSVLGDPHGVNWLLSRMNEPKHAKMAGHAFCQMTGVDLVQQGLAGNRSSGSDSDGEEDVPVFNEYENLPIPHVEKVSQHWQTIRHRFCSGQRYFLGQPIEPLLLKQTVVQGSQSQRLAAAVEFALLDGSHAYPNAKARLHI